MKFAFCFLYTLLLIGSASFQAVAQKTFVPGYLVTPSLDTLHGLIADKNWRKNPLTIEFKKTTQAASREYSASQVKSFHLAPDQFYESHLVSIDKSPMDIAGLAKSDQRIVVKDTLFLLLCLKGKVSLYQYTDESNKIHFYVKNENDSLEELLVNHHLKEYEGKKMLLVDKQYQRQLNSLLLNCPSLQAKSKNVPFTRHSLQKLLLAYNQCTTGSENTFVAVEKKAKVKIGLLAGGSITKLAFKGNTSNDLIAANFPKAHGYTAGLSVEFFLKGLQQWSLANELRWKAYQTDAFYKQVHSANRYDENTVSFDLGYASLVNMVRYHLPFKTLRPFVNIGISNAFALKTDNSKLVESHFYTTYRKEQQKALEDFRKYEQGLVFGVGAGWRKWSGECRYELGNGMSEYRNLQSTTKTVNLLLTFQLN